MTGRDLSQGLEQRVEDALSERLPAVDLLEFVVEGEMMRAVVDHPDGVDHDLCVSVTRALEAAGLLEEFGLEVWSPGPEPPLRRPEHFRRAIGRRVKIRLLAGEEPSSYTGTLVAVEDDAVSVDARGAVVRLPFASIRRARALEE